MFKNSCYWYKLLADSLVVVLEIGLGLLIPRDTSLLVAAAMLVYYLKLKSNRSVGLQRD